MNFIKVTIIAIIITFPTYLSLFHNEFFHMHDFTHVARTVEMHQAIEDGHIPPRWSRNLGFGYGLPQFSFYAPLPYYVTSKLYDLGLTAVNSVKALFFLNTLGSFIAMYYASKVLWKSHQSALLSATAFIYIPYRAVDSYVRGALGELSAITFVALTYWAILNWREDRTWKNSVYISLSIAGIVLSHNLVALISVPFITIFLLISALSKKSKKGNSAIQAIISLILGIATSAYYALPALTEKSYTMVDLLTTGFSDFRQHFLYLRQFIHSPWGFGGSIFGPEDDLSFEIGKIQLMLVALTILGIGTRWKNISRKSKYNITFLIAATGASILLATFKTQWLWEYISLMSYIQFPWRYLSIIIVFVSLILGGFVAVKTALIPKKWLKITTGLLVGGLIIVNNQLFKPVDYLDNNEGLYYKDPSRIQAEMSGIIPDFMPKTTAKLPLIPPNARFELLGADSGTIDIELDKTQEFIINTHIKQPTTLKINIAHFPGWELYLNGKSVPFEIDEKIPTMNIKLTPSPDPQIISGIFNETPIRKLADITSLVSLLGLGYLYQIKPERKLS